MKVVVCSKYIPDPNLPMTVDPERKRLVRDPAQSILDPGDEFGIEAALKLVEEHGGEVVVVSMGPEAADTAIRRAMAMGVERAILVTDPGLEGSDALTTAQVLSRVVATEEPDVVICATESTDAYTGMVPGAMAAMLDFPQLTFVRSIQVEGSTITVQRDYENGYQSVKAELPVLITVTASIAEPRYPSFKGMMQAKKKPIDTRDLGAIGLDAGQAGQAGARERVLEIRKVEIDKQTRVIEDDGAGSSVDEIVNYLKQVQVI
ncbi:MAG: electron transfer flavoprotein subunit beta/FixA family protein [Thermomicrobiaceae bacterium]